MKNPYRQNNKAYSAQNSKSGITLLEVMLAVVIIAVFVTLLTVSRDDIMSKAINTNSLRTARMLASQKMEAVILADMLDDESMEMASGSFDNYPGFSWYSTSEEISIITTTEREENPSIDERYVKRLTVGITYEKEDGTKDFYRLATILPYKKEASEGSPEDEGEPQNENLPLPEDE
ncbi:MAG: prepilin-type N-terminal cleavage/methylation domain-containing protein [Planctomycetota bacterium]